MIRTMLTVSALAACGLAMAKLPPLDDAAKAKAAETAARTSWQGKVDAFLTCKAQDRVVAHYKRTAATRPMAPASAATTTPTENAAVAAATAPVTAVPAPPAAVPAAAVASATAKMAAAAPAANQVVASSSTPATPTGTPVAPSGTPVVVAAAAGSCQDPGPFAYAPAEQKPLETSGAHSPASNAISPPSVRPESATMNPAGPATQQSKKP